MDTWQATQSWLLFTAVVVGLGAYYSYSQRDQKRPSTVANRRSSVERVDVPGAPKGANKKRKAPRKERTPVQAPPTVVVQNNEPDETEDISNRQFAEQMAKARRGADLSAVKGKENRLKTVKQSSASNPPVSSSESSQAGADADDDMSSVPSPALHGGDVSDMLEPAVKGPSTLRLTASTQPLKQKVSRQSKEEVVESKKQRQNRMKKEQQRLEREAEEKERRVLEEKQRRAAREARGEPARNGLGVSKPPTHNAWSAPKPAQEATAPASTTNGPLLDTFDAESTASSNGGMDVSTAATSTTDPESTVNGHEQDHGHGNGKLSEDEQMAMAMRQSEDESGWTTVAVPKKQQKKSSGEASGDSTPGQLLATAGGAPASKPAANAKPKGFLALHVEGDVNDPSTWEA